MSGASAGLALADLFSCVGQVAVITGGASGIGLACAEALAAAGAKVALIGLAESQPEQAAESLRQRGYEATGIAADVTDRGLLDSALEQVRSVWGPVDTVLANAGTNVAADVTEVESLDKMFDLHVRAVVCLAELTIPDMAARSGGSFIIMSSIAGLRGNRLIGGYGVTKAANAQLARNLAVTWGPHGVRANAIAPGVIVTEFARPITGDERIAAGRLEKTPLRRFGKPTEVAGAVVWLASPTGAFVNGQTIVIDGGTLISD